MLDPLKELLGLPWVGGLLGIAGLVSGLYLYLRSVREPRAFFSIDGFNVIGLNAESEVRDHVTAAYRGETVPRLSVAGVWIWNGGTALLKSDMVAKRGPLVMKLPEGAKFLETTLVDTSAETSGFRVVQSGVEPPTVQIEFDEIAPKEGAFLRVLHTGPPDSLKVAGTINGRPISDEFGPPSARTRLRRVQLLSNVIFGATFLAFLWFRGRPESALFAWIPGEVETRSKPAPALSKEDWALFLWLMVTAVSFVLRVRLSHDLPPT